MAVDPVITVGSTSSIIWTFDDPAGYSVYDGGGYSIAGGILSMLENTPQGSLSGADPTQIASGWATNQNDDDGLDILQTVSGETVDSGPAYDSTSLGTVSQKIRGNCAAAVKDANLTMRGTSTASNLQIHVWRMYANSQGTASTRNGFIGLWTNSTTPQLGILWDPADGTLPNTLILASGGVSAWPSFNTEESTGISRTTDQWIFVLWAGSMITVGSTDYHTRVVVMNTTVVKKELSITSSRTTPTGRLFGCKVKGDYSGTPAYFDSYKVWEGSRYPSVSQVLFPPARPDSLRSVTAQVTATQSGVDRGGSVTMYYRKSSDGGATWGSFALLSTITSDTFNGNGDDVIQPMAVMLSDGTSPNTGLFGLFSPAITTVQLAFTTKWEEKQPVTSLIRFSEVA